MVVTGRVLVDGTARGPFLPLAAPISFWGGVDPESGQVVDPRHPDHGVRLQGAVCWIPSTIGSSSSSSVLLELIRTGHAPAALLLGEIDPILALGAVVAAEMGWPPPPVLHVVADVIQSVTPGQALRVHGGRVTAG